MSEELSPLGLPKLFTWAIYYESILKKRHWSLSRLEEWLESHGLSTLGDGKSERGFYIIVGTGSFALYQMITSTLEIAGQDGSGYTEGV